MPGRKMFFIVGSQQLNVVGESVARTKGRPGFFRNGFVLVTIEVAVTLAAYLRR